MRGDKVKRSLSEDASELISNRSPFIADTPPEQWAAIGPLVLCSILSEKEYEDIPARLANSTREAFSDAFGTDDDTPFSNSRGRAAMRGDGGKQGGKPAGSLMLASGRRTQR